MTKKTALKKKNISIEDYKKLQETYQEQLNRKDRIIEELKKENILLLKTALKQSSKQIDLEANFKKRDLLQK